MDVSDAKYPLKRYKVIATSIFAITFPTRFLHFYIIPGLVEMVGWGTAERLKGRFWIPIIVFLAATWTARHYLIRLFAQICSIIALYFCEILFMEYSGYSLKRTAIGLWLYVAELLLLLFYCICIEVKWRQNSTKENKIRKV